MSNQEKRPNVFVRMGGWFRKSWSELKKVSWPTFPEVVKDTGIVLVIVGIFLVIVTALDFGLFELLKLMTGG